MDWIGAIILWTLAGLVAVAWIVSWLWSAIGRRRDQPECPHSDLVRLLERDGTPSGVVLCLMCDERLLAPTNGASSSGATGTSGDAKNG
jgi:hypothetical protein